RLSVARPPTTARTSRRVSTGPCGRSASATLACTRGRCPKHAGSRRSTHARPGGSRPTPSASFNTQTTSAGWASTRGDDHVTEWPDMRTAYDVVAQEYAAAFDDELRRKPFDRELLGRFADEVGSGAVWDVGCG